jgi:hypothetical protein
MGTVSVQTNNGLLNFTIAGDTPNPAELAKIQRIVANQSIKAQRDSTRRQAEQKFDYRTGIQNNELRRKLSRADTPEEEVLALKSMGLSEADFTRDYRGRLALTPQGAKNFGVESDRNVLIDERGLTRSDFADLSSLGREIAGGIGGALIGQAAIPIPILGAMIGAGAGTGGAKLLEEAQEVVQGTQGQTASEVFKDAGTEALIGAAGEGAGQVLFKTVGRLFGKPGRDLTPEQLELAGKSMEYGVTPTLSQVGANKLVSRQQAMGEKVLGTSKRLRDNHQAITAKIEDFRSSYGASSPDEVADVMINAAKTGNKLVSRQRKDISKGIVDNLRQANEALGAATARDATIDDDTFKIFANAYKQFDDDMQSQFAAINKLVDDPAGNIPSLNVAAIKKDAQDRLNQFSGVTTGNQKIAEDMLRGIANLPDKASFAQVYRARKSLNDTWLSRYGSSNVEDVKKKFLGRLDEQLELKEINRALKRVALKSIPDEQKDMYKAAAKAIPDARANFKKGIEQFEGIHGKLGVRNLVSSVKGGKEVDTVGAANTLIKPNNPKLLKDAEKAVGGSSIFTPIKTRIGAEWLRTAFKDATKANRKGVMSFHKLHDQIEKLGSTGEELFGKNFPEIKKLASQMNVMSLSDVSQSMIDDVVAEGADQSAISLLRNLKSAVDEQASMKSSRAIKALQDGSITPQAAAEVIANRATKDVDVAKLVKYFESPEDLNKIRAFYVDNIIGDFGDAFLTDPKQFKLFGQRLQDEYKTGKLNTIFGDDVAKDMNEFGRVMVFNSKAAEGGDLVAANIAAKPLENLGTLARLSVIGRVLSTGPQYKSIMRQYKEMAAGKSEKTRAEIFGNLLASAFGSATSQAPAQIIQEGAQEGSRQLSALLDTAQSQMKAPTPPRTPVPQVQPAIQPEQISAPDPAQQPMGMMGIRERAKGNPAVALSLLGGLGSAGLL